MSNFEQKIFDAVREAVRAVYDIEADESLLVVETPKDPKLVAEWENQFGVPFEEHKKLLQINIFDGYTVFGIQNNMKQEIKNNA